MIHVPYNVKLEKLFLCIFKTKICPDNEKAV